MMKDMGLTNNGRHHLLLSYNQLTAGPFPGAQKNDICSGLGGLPDIKVCI